MVCFFSPPNKHDQNRSRPGGCLPASRLETGAILIVPGPGLNIHFYQQSIRFTCVLVLRSLVQEPPGEGRSKTSDLKFATGALETFFTRVLPTAASKRQRRWVDFLQRAIFSRSRLERPKHMLHAVRRDGSSVAIAMFYFVRFASGKVRVKFPDDEGQS